MVQARLSLCAAAVVQAARVWNTHSDAKGADVITHGARYRSGCHIRTYSDLASDPHAQGWACVPAGLAAHAAAARHHGRGRAAAGLPRRVPGLHRGRHLLAAHACWAPHALRGLHAMGISARAMGCSAELGLGTYPDPQRSCVRGAVDRLARCASPCSSVWPYKQSIN